MVLQSTAFDLRKRLDGLKAVTNTTIEPILFLLEIVVLSVSAGLLDQRDPMKPDKNMAHFVEQIRMSRRIGHLINHGKQ